jgi:hypothetical protein
MTISATTQGIKPGVCTSTNKPAAPFDGQVIYMTDVDQTAVWDGSTWVVLAPIAGGRNLLINGDFKVWQRGNARTYMNAGSYLADRWTIHLFQNGGHERVAGRATQYAMRVTSSSAAENGGGTRMWLTQKVESSNSYRLRSQQVTLSFWVRFSAATCSSSTATPYGNFTGTIGYYTSTTDSATGNTSENTGTSITLTNGSLPTTWTKYSVTGTCPSNLNNIHASFGFGGLGNTAANSGVWYEIAEVQLEAGAVATPFEFEDFGVTLAKCQRYFCSLPVVSVDAYGVAGSAVVSRAIYPVPMRALPTLTTGTMVAQGNNSGAFSFDSATSSIHSGTIYITASTSARAYYYAALTASIEL